MRIRRAWRRLRAMAWVGLLGAILPGSGAIAAEIRVAAASDLRFALAELALLHRDRTGDRIRASYGASGNLSRQLLQGAPFELFFSANRDYAQRLVDAGITRGTGREYGRGRLVLYAAGDSPLADVLAGNAQAAAVLSDPRLRRLAIANPAHAPYGVAARAVLQRLGLWDSIQSKLVLGENAAQATQFAVTGNVDAGLVPHATVLAPALAGTGVFRLVEAALHPPLRQWVVPLAAASEAAMVFYQDLATPDYRAVLHRYGFR